MSCSWINWKNNSIVIDGLHASAPKNTHDLIDQCCLCDAKQENSGFPWISIANKCNNNQKINVYLNCVFVDNCSSCIFSLVWLLQNNFNVYSREWSKLHYKSVDSFIKCISYKPPTLSKVSLMIYGDSNSMISCHEKELESITKLKKAGFPDFYQ